MRELAQAYLTYSRVTNLIQEHRLSIANIKANSTDTTSVKSKQISEYTFAINVLEQKLPSLVERVKAAREVCPPIGTAAFTFGDEIYSVNNGTIAIIKSTPLKDELNYCTVPWKDYMLYQNSDRKVTKEKDE